MTAGKGDRIRLYNRQRWDAGWDRAFGRTPTPFFDEIKRLDKILKKANRMVDDDLETIDGTVEIDTPKAPKGNNKRRLRTPGKPFRSSRTSKRRYNIPGMARWSRGTNDES